MISRIRRAVAGGGLTILVPIVATYVIGGQFLPVRVLSQFSFSNALISTILILWLYRGTARAALQERSDVGYMWFAAGFTILVGATVLNVSYGTWNYIWHITVISGNSVVLSGVRFCYGLAFWAIIVAKMTRGDERVPPRGWGTIVGIIVAAVAMTSGIIWWRGEM